jgi:hypothetical protein
MTIEQLGSIGESISAVAVVASLIFVGFELRRNDRTHVATVIMYPPNVRQW